MGMKLPNGATLAVSAAFGAAIAITGISNANPGIAAAPANGLSAGDIVLLDSGWESLADRAVRVLAPSTDAFTLEGMDTTDIGHFPIGMGLGTAREVTSWVGIDQVLGSAFAGGEQQWWNYSFLEGGKTKGLKTDKSARTLTLTLGYDEDKPWYAALQACDRSDDTRILRLTLKSGKKLYYPGMIGFNDQPTLTKNEGMVVTAVLSINADFTRYAS